MKSMFRIYENPSRRISFRFRSVMLHANLTTINHFFHDFRAGVELDGKYFEIIHQNIYSTSCCVLFSTLHISTILYILVLAVIIIF